MGSFIPFTLKKFGLDPASGSSIFATGCTDTGLTDAGAYCVLTGLVPSQLEQAKAAVAGLGGQVCITLKLLEE